MPSLLTRKIGDTDVTAIGYGAMGISALYGPIDSDEERLKVFSPLYNSLCSLLTNIYSFWTSCTLVDVRTGTPPTCTATLRTSSVNGERYRPRSFYLLTESWYFRFKKTGKRDEIFIATKFGSTGDPNRLVNGDPDYEKACMDRSLHRLGGNFPHLNTLSVI